MDARTDCRRRTRIRRRLYRYYQILGWFVADDESSGKIVYHPGGDIGYTSYFLRNTTKDQTIIILSNIELLRHYTPTALMKILNNEPYKLDVKSLAAAMGKEYNRRGIEAALKNFYELKSSDEYSLGEDDINELGYRLLYDKKDAPAAIEVFKLNAEQFPKSFNVWDSLGEVYYQTGNTEEAVKNYEKSLQLNPKTKAAEECWKEYAGAKNHKCESVVKSEQK